MTVQQKNIPALRFPEFDGEWEDKRLGEVGETYNGLTGKTAIDFGSGKPYITYMQVFGNSKINEESNGFVNILASENQNKVQFGDIIFTTSSETPNEVGFSSVYMGNTAELYLNSFCFGFRPYSLTQLTPAFSRYLFRSPKFRDDIFKLAQGSTRYNLSKVQMLKLSIALPELAEQQKIADFLSAVDERIQQLTRKKELLEQYKKGVMQQLFSQQIRFKDDNGNDYPDWEEKSIADIASTLTDYVANGSFESLRENVIVKDTLDYAFYVRLVDLRAGIGHKDQKYVDKDSFNFLSKSSLSGGELLIANIGANVGEVWQMPKVEKPATLAPNMLMAKFKKGVDSRYVFYFLDSAIGKKNISIIISGSGHPKISKTDLKTVKVLLPKDTQEQKMIADFLSSIDDKISSVQVEIEQTQLFKKGLLQQMFV